MLPSPADKSSETAPVTIPDVSGLDIPQAALAYANAGVPIALFDATRGEGNSKGKQCGNLIGSRTDAKNWYDHVSTDPEVIEDWLKKYGTRANGIATSPGEVHMVVPDIDHPEHIPADWWPHLDAAPFTNTRPEEPKRGHYWFRCPDSGERFGNPAFDWGELRCAGGGLVLPPTPVGARIWIRHGIVPVLPEVIAQWLREQTTRAVWVGISSEDVAEFTREHHHDERPNALAGLVNAVRDRRSATRNTARDNMRVAAGESRIVFYPWKRARDEFESAMRDSYQARGEPHKFSVRDFSRLEENAVAFANAQTLEFLTAVANRSYGHRHDCLGSEIDEARLWERPILKHIYTASLSRQMDPRGVLAVTLARAICSIAPYVTIPGIISSRSSLNLHVALVGPSSGGKSSSVAVAKEAVKVTPEPDTPTLDSGEGIPKAYAYRDKTGAIVTVTDTLLFCDTEIESVEALAKRSGSPLMSQWRKTFTGERLGFSYSDPKHRIPVLDHKYRFCQILGIQPELAGWLLKGIQKSAGTPQRILWAPVIYPDMPRPEELPSWPGCKTLPKWPGPKPRQANEGKFSFRVAQVDQPADEKVLQANELQIPPEIESEIREARNRFHHGEMDDLSGHSMLTMLKVAAGFMWLDGRTDKITDEDRELAAIVMAISDRTRKHTLAALEKLTKHADAARGKSDARRELAKAGLLEDERRADIDRVIARIVPRLAAANEKTMSGGEFRRAMRDVSRDLLEEAMTVLADEGRVVAAEIEYHGQRGRKYTLIEDGQQTY